MWSMLLFSPGVIHLLDLYFLFLKFHFLFHKKKPLKISALFTCSKESAIIAILIHLSQCTALFRQQCSKLNYLTCFKTLLKSEMSSFSVLGLLWNPLDNEIEISGPQDTKDQSKLSDHSSQATVSNIQILHHSFKPSVKIGKPSPHCPTVS